MLDINALPNDMQALKRLVIEQHSASEAKDIELREQQALIEHLRFQLAKLRRARFGQSSEQLEGAGQLPMSFEELKAAVLTPIGSVALAQDRAGRAPSSSAAASQCPRATSTVALRSVTLSRSRPSARRTSRRAAACRKDRARPGYPREF